MFRYLLFMSALVSTYATAQPAHDDQRTCILKGNAYQWAASDRDQGVSPQEAYKAMTAANLSGVSNAYLKKAINLVYFDPGFVNAGGTALMQQVYTACMHPEGLYKPLE